MKKEKTKKPEEDVTGGTETSEPVEMVVHQEQSTEFDEDKRAVVVREEEDAVEEEEDIKREKMKLERERKRKEKLEKEEQELLAKKAERSAAAEEQKQRGKPAATGSAGLLSVDAPLKAQRSPSPARQPVSCQLHIRHLVRPYTLGQLKQLLSQHGPLAQEGFWIDRIKSHCICTFEQEADAKAARQALHGATWPSSNPNTLRVDYASQEEVSALRPSLPPFSLMHSLFVTVGVLPEWRRGSLRATGVGSVTR